MCNKVPYETKADAREHARLVLTDSKHRNKSRMCNRKLRPYWCPACYKWHLTSSAKRKWM